MWMGDLWSHWDTAVLLQRAFLENSAGSAVSLKPGVTGRLGAARCGREWSGQSLLSVLDRRSLQLYWFVSLFQPTVQSAKLPPSPLLPYWSGGLSTVSVAGLHVLFKHMPLFRVLTHPVLSLSLPIPLSDPSLSPCSRGLDVVERMKGAGFWRASSHVQPGIQRILGGWMQWVVLWQREHHCISLWGQKEKRNMFNPVRVQI